MAVKLGASSWQGVWMVIGSRVERESREREERALLFPEWAGTGARRGRFRERL
jgi:hypothetical protein